jgi:nucleotide-binding universal stress UspA family protein
MTTRILVPVDYSDRSREALHCAALLANGLGARITVLHAWDCPPIARTARTAAPSTSAEVGLDQLLVEAAQRELETFVASADLVLRTPPALELSSLSPLRAVLETIESGQYELVVMGTHGRAALKALVLGSVARRVLELSPIPVVLVPDTAKRQHAEMVR